MTIEVFEHASAGYPPRTRQNAASADLTVAFALDFGTAGEKLTRSAAGDRYVAIPLDQTTIEAARTLFRALRAHNAKTLNVAGNGIYTLTAKGWSQERVDDWVLAVLSLAHQHWPLSKVISGGQTGVDLAGARAGASLGIPVAVTLPKGFVQRGADNLDVTNTRADIEAQIMAGVTRQRVARATAGVIPKGRIRVGSKRRGGVPPEPGEVQVDGDRASPVFGNRHHLKDWRDADERARVIEKHRLEDFEPDVLRGGPIYQEMKRLAERVREGEHLILMCWCKPLPCHCDHIADGIDRLAHGLDLQEEVRAAVNARDAAKATAPRERGQGC